jgi:hypothetical protein
MSDNNEFVRVIKPDTSLKDRIGSDVNLRDILKPEVIEEAQQVIDEKKDEYLDLIRQDIAQMEAIFEKMPDVQVDMQLLATLLQHAQNVRDRAGTFHYQLASDIARSLINYSGRIRQDDAHYRLVLRKHLDGIQTVFRENITGSGGLVGVDLLESLQLLIEKYRPQG